MPTYQYKCLNGHEFEETRKINEDQKIKLCSECGHVLKQVYSSPGIQLKGGGFYRNNR
jgi:putative FmdB family regulatory protein